MSLISLGPWKSLCQSYQASCKRSTGSKVLSSRPERSYFSMESHILGCSRLWSFIQGELNRKGIKQKLVHSCGAGLLMLCLHFEMSRKLITIIFGCNFVITSLTGNIPAQQNEQDLLLVKVLLHLRQDLLPLRSLVCFALIFKVIMPYATHASKHPVGRPTNRGGYTGKQVYLCLDC